MAVVPLLGPPAEAAAPDEAAGASRPARPGRAPALLVALTLALNLYGIDWGLPNGTFDWSNDSVAPLEPLAWAKRTLHGEPWTSKYPPFHLMVLAAAYAPYLGLLALTGGFARPTDAYPYGFADPERALMVLTLIARLVSVGMGVGLVVLTALTARRLAGPRAGTVAGLLVATSLPVVHYAHNANVDVPHLFWTALALWALVAYLQTAARRHAVTLGLAAAAAVGTKSSVYALFVGVALVLLGAHVQHLRRTVGLRGWHRAPGTRHLAAGLAAFALGLVVTFNVPFNWQGVARHVERHLRQSVRGSQVIQQAPSPLQGELALIGSYLRFLGEANAPPVAALLAAGLGWALLRARPLAVLVAVPAITYYLLFLRLHGTHHLRYVLPVYLLLTWPAAALAARALESEPVRRRLALAALAVALGWGGLDAASVGLRYTRDPRYEAEAWLRAHVPAGTTVVGVTPNYTLPRFPEGVRVERREIWDYGGTQVGDLVDLAPAYVAIGLNLPVRRTRPGVVEEFFRARGYSRQVEFAPRVPFFAREIEDLHSLSPRVAIYARASAAAGAPVPEGRAPGTGR